jgi:hypothetical protein
MAAHRPAARGGGRGDRVPPHPARAAGRPQARAGRRPAARVGPLRGEVLDARHDGDGPQRRPQRPLRPRPGEPLRRPALRLGLLPPPGADVRQDRARDRRRGLRTAPGRRQAAQGLHQRSLSGRRRPRGPGRHVPASRARRDRLPLPAGPPRAADGRRGRGLPVVEHRPRPDLPAAGEDPRRPGDRRQHHVHGLRQPRGQLRHRRGVHPRPGHRPPRPVRRLPAEGAGRGRRRRHPQHAQPGRPRAPRQGLARRAPAHHEDAREPLPRPVRHRVHDRARQALDAADPGRQADRRGGLTDRRPAGRRGCHRPRHRGDPRHRAPARTA